jgi:hypothetical protein
MPVDKNYQIRRLESLERMPPEEERDGATTSDLHPSPQVALEALRATAGADEVFKQIPSIENFAAWVFIAYFSVCSKSVPPATWTSGTPIISTASRTCRSA